jgi:DNA-binding LacI/PurR family transcriptional regulator
MNDKYEARRLAGDKLYASLQQIINQNPAGTILTSERKLASQYNISLGTVRRVMQRLVEEGLIEKIHGKGNIICEKETDPNRNQGTIIFADFWTGGFHPFFTSKIQGLLDEARVLRYDLQICGLHEGHSQLCNSLYHPLRQPGIVGLIYPYNNPGFLKTMREEHPSLPVIFDLESCQLSYSANIAIDYHAIGYQAAEYCLLQKPKSITILYTNQSTLQGAQEFINGSSKPCTINSQYMPEVEDELDATLKAYKNAPAIIFDDETVFQKFKEVCPKAVTRLEKRSTIITTKNAMTSSSEEPTRATFEIDGYKFGQLSIRMLDQLRHANIFSNTTLNMPPRLILPTTP